VVQRGHAADRLEGSDALRQVGIHNVVEQNLGLRYLLQTSTCSSSRLLIGFKSDDAAAHRCQTREQEPVTTSDIEGAPTAQRRVPHDAPVKGDIVVPIVIGH